MTIRDEAKDAGKQVVSVGIAAATAALIAWIRTRPIKRAIEKRRAAKAAKRGG